MFILFSEQAHGRPTWFARVTWCLQAPHWWPLAYIKLYIQQFYMNVLYDFMKTKIMLDKNYPMHKILVGYFKQK